MELILNRLLSFINSIRYIFKVANYALLVIELHHFVLDLYQKLLMVFFIFIKKTVFSQITANHQMFDSVCKCDWQNNS